MDLIYPYSSQRTVHQTTTIGRKGFYSVIMQASVACSRMSTLGDPEKRMMHVCL